MYDIVILTEERYENPKKIDWYIQQVLTEDQILKSALEKKGLRVIRKNWADKKFDWSKTKYAIFRTTWDYFDKFDEFFKWIDSIKNKCELINSFDLIKWNIDKFYLKEMQKQGINIAKTLFINQTQNISLKKLFEKTNWKEAVIKPAISGAARHTYRINRMNLIQYEAIFQKLISNECMLFQEFLNNILNDGEISLIMINGKYTHAVKKNAKYGDFRVQDDHGGKVTEYTATQKEIDFAKKCLTAIPFNQILYARVDIVKDNNNQLSLSEIELIEPELWFRNYPQSADILAHEITKLTFSK